MGDESKTNVSASLFSANSIIEETKSSKTKQSVFADLDDDEDDILVFCATKKKKESENKSKDNLFGESDDEDFDAFAGSFKKESDDQIKNEPEKKQKKSEKVLFKDSGVGGGFDLFDDDDDDDDFVKVKQSKAKESVVTNAKNVETEKVDFDPLANEISETQKDITPDAPKDAKSEIVKDTKEKNEKLAMFNDDNDAFGIASSENVIISKQKTLGPQKEELVDNEVDVQSHENVKEKVEENQNEKEEETKFKKPGKLADKFGHLNFDPT